MHKHTVIDFSLGQLPSGQKIKLDKGHILYDHHDQVDDLYFLLEGTIQIYQTLDFPRKDILVGKTSQYLTPVGWNGLNPPGRSMSKIKVASKNAIFHKIAIPDFLELIEQTSQSDVLREMCSHVYDQFESCLLKQLKSSRSDLIEKADHLENYFISTDSSDEDIVQLMRRSPFLEDFEEKYLKHLADVVERRNYVSGELIYEQDLATHGLYILIQGEVAIRRLEDQRSLSLRSISTPGFIFGWSSLIGVADFCTATTAHETSVYYIEQEAFVKLINDDPEFGKAFYRRLLWLTGNQLHIAHMRLVSMKLNHDQLAIHNLIENNRAKLKISSPLHQVPHLLRDRNTLQLAYELLHRLNEVGQTQERHLASLCLDLLKHNKKEHRFLQGLYSIYEAVAENNEDLSPLERRKLSAELVRNLFTPLNHHIEGWDNLPDEPGHIFIYNHLLNDPYYTLPNNFQITLDSHFISSLILDIKYDDPGLRIVRLGKGAEYGHQNYYNNLGHINVYTRDSGQADSDNRAQVRQIFYEEGGKHLKQGNNLIISPEGISYSTEDSPGPFKGGAFHLALQQEKEPLIVPIALSYFDRRIYNNVFFCQILKPFKISEQLEDGSKQSLKNFVKQYQRKFAREVRRSAKLADNLLKNHDA